MNTYHIFKDAIVVHVDGKTMTIARDDERYSKILEAIQGNDVERIGIIVNRQTVDALLELIGF